jgi:Tfp pilus assembly protein PilO
LKQLDLKEFKPWQIDAAGVGLCVLLTLGLYLLGVSPWMQQQKDLHTKELELTTQRYKASRLATTKLAVGEQLAEVQESTRRYKLELKPAGQINRRIAAVSELASKAGLKIDDITPGAAVSAARYEMVPIRLAGQGTYLTCVSFLSRLRRALPDTGVSALELRGDPANPDDTTGFRFDLLWYAAPRSSL